MQNTSAESSENQGDGIYEKRETERQTITIEDNVTNNDDYDELLLSNAANFTNANHLDSNHNEVRRGFLQNNEPTGLDSILNVLNQQLENLDKLKQTTASKQQQQKQPSASISILSNETKSTNTSANCDFEYLIRHTKRSSPDSLTNSQTSRPSSSSASAALTRKFLLDNYIESSIKEKEHDCDCCYHLNIDDLDHYQHHHHQQNLSELDETFYREELSPIESAPIASCSLLRDIVRDGGKNGSDHKNENKSNYYVRHDKQQVRSGLVAGGAVLKTLNDDDEYVSGTEIECRNVSSTSAISSGHNCATTTAYPTCRWPSQNDDEADNCDYYYHYHNYRDEDHNDDDLDGGSSLPPAEQACHYHNHCNTTTTATPSNQQPSHRSPDQQHYKQHRRRQPTEVDSLFIDSESVLSLERRQIRTAVGGRCRRRRCCRPPPLSRACSSGAPNNQLIIICTRSENDLSDQAIYGQQRATNLSSDSVIPSPSASPANIKQSLPELSVRCYSGGGGGGGGEEGSSYDNCCHCCGHQFSNSSEVSSTLDSDENYDEDEYEEDLDAAFDTRSALDCVEESPSNNELSILSAINNPTGDLGSSSRLNLDRQLYCSLTNDSTISRQNSPVNSFAGESSLLDQSTEALGQLESPDSLNNSFNCKRPSSKQQLELLGGPSSSSLTSGSRACLNLPVVNWINFEYSGAAEEEISPFESSAWLSLHKMRDSDEDNACKTNSNSQTIKHDETKSTRGVPNLSDLLVNRDKEEEEQGGEGEQGGEEEEGQTGAPDSSDTESLAARKKGARANDNPHHHLHCDHRRENLDSPKSSGNNNGNSNSNNNIPTGLKLNDDLGPESETQELLESDSHRRDSTKSLSSSLSDTTNITGAAKTTNDVLVSMRAAKDLVKLSIPSLSSLQYLPSQMDIRPAQLVDQRCSKQPANTGTSTSTNTSTSMNQTDRQLEQAGSGERSQPASPTVKGASKGHDDNSCILHRLCLCNCMSRNSHNLNGASDHPAPHGRHKSSFESSSSSNTAAKLGSRKQQPTTAMNLAATVSVASRSPIESSFGDSNSGSSKPITKASTSHEPMPLTSPGVSSSAPHLRGALGSKNFEVSRRDDDEEEEEDMSWRETEAGKTAAKTTTKNSGRVTKEFNSSSLTVEDVNDGALQRRQSRDREEQRQTLETTTTTTTPPPPQARQEKQSLAFLSLLSGQQDERRGVSSTTSGSQVQDERIETNDHKSASSQEVVKNLRGRFQQHHDHSTTTTAEARNSNSNSKSNRKSNSDSTNPGEEVNKLNAKRGSLLVGSDGFGSIGDLGASGRSSSASGTYSEACSPLSRSNERSDESCSFNTESGRKSADILLSDGDEDECDVKQEKKLLGAQTYTDSVERRRTRGPTAVGADDEAHAHGVCHSCKQHSSSSSVRHKRRLTRFRKLLLTPNKLFTSKSTSSICEHHPTTPDSSQQEHEQHEANQKQLQLQPQAAQSESKSFLSRSLSRLSGRKHQHHHHTLRKQVGKNNKNQDKPDDQQRSLSACGSPDVSLLSNLSQPTSDSINSLDDELALTYSLPFEINHELRIHEPKQRSSTRLLKAPKIVLSKVEYQDRNSGEDHSPQQICSCSDNMARSTAGSPGGHWHSRVARDANRARDNRGNINRAPPPSHHGSELSFGSQDGAGGETLARGPISMPGSPRSSSSSSSSRRRRQQSNSPRMNQSPVPFHSPPTESTKIEDGLKVCSIEHFEKHIGNIKDDQIEAQKRLFTVWINHFAPNLIRHDLFEELRDGTKIIGLLAALTRDRDLIAKYERLMKDRQTYVNRLVLSPGGQMRNLSNVQFAIDYLRTKLNMRLVSLHPMDIVGSKANVILGLCWSIILHFQLDRDLFKDSETSSQLSDSLCTTSPLSSGSTRDDDQRTAPQSTRITHNRQNLNLTQPPRHKSSTGGGEFTQKELAHAREKLLEHINKRFNLKLTNLTSSLVDGDVLLAIIKQLLWPAQEHFNKNNPKLSNWRTMSDDEKLDCCFELANEYLNVPKLISASDLRRQTISENNTKPLLVYLSMLLKSNPRNCSTDQMLELRQLDESLEGSNQQAAVAVTKSFPNIVLAGQQQEPNVANADDSSFEHNLATKEEILAAIDELDTDDERFHIHKLQTSIARINQIERSLKDHGLRSNDDDATTTTLKRFTNLKQQADQIEFLISWINKADKLFERKQKSSSDLAKTIEEYQSFFAPSNLPQVNTALCPTLERQYRECLATAKQRVLSMEQTMKNWISYEQARQDLRNWLKTAEMKLTDSLRPDSSTNTTSPTAQPFKQDGSSVDYVGHYSSRLDDLIEYFELEPVDIDDLERAQNCSFLSSSLQDELSTSSLNNSLSGSLLSLGSNTSRLSALTSSKKATYGRLFDNFELKCRLLATMLDSDQRDSLLLGVRELKSRLKYIIDCKVPQVINEIRLSIDRCEMSIKEQDEICSDLEQEAVESLDRVLASNDNDEEDDGDDDDDEVSSPSEQQNMDDLKRDNNSSTTNTTSPECTSDVAAASVVYDDGANDLIMTKSKEKKRNRNNKANNNKSKTKSSQHHNQKSGSKKSNSSSTPTKTLVKVTSKVSACVGDNDDECIPYYRMLWNKICRASKMSLSFNIVLLVCLAGICIIPLIQRDACCELSQAPVPSDRFTINQRPT